MKVVLHQKLSSPNLHESWRAKHTRDKKQRTVLRQILSYEKRPTLPVVITLNRVGKKRMDYDNLVFAFKGIRDEVADYLIPGLRAGRADDDKRLTFQYTQSISTQYSIEVTIDSRDKSCAVANPTQV